MSVRPTSPLAELLPGRVYQKKQLAEIFNIQERYLNAAGMRVLKDLNTVLLMSYPGGGKQFDYRDRWLEPTLLDYCGEGQRGDQRLQGANRYVAEGTHNLILFEGAGANRLRYRGRVRCEQVRVQHQEDRAGNSRKVFRFNLRLEESSPDAGIRQSKYGPGELEAHRLLKLYVAANPSVVGFATSSAWAETEHRFLSPDTVDVVVHEGERSTVVEVEPTPTGCLVAAWQAIKYRGLLCIERELPLDSPLVSAWLVAHSLPDDARAVCDAYRVNYLEVDPQWVGSWWRQSGTRLGLAECMPRLVGASPGTHEPLAGSCEEPQASSAVGNLDTGVAAQADVEVEGGQVPYVQRTGKLGRARQVVLPYVPASSVTARQAELVLATSDATGASPAPPSTEADAPELPERARTLFEALLREQPLPVDRLRSQLEQYIRAFEAESQTNGYADVVLAEDLRDHTLVLLAAMPTLEPSRRALAQAAVRYLVIIDDGDMDYDEDGLRDDAQVVSAVLDYLGLSSAGNTAS